MAPSVSDTHHPLRMTAITASEASQRILAAADEGRLIQGRWHAERGGRELACMLGAIDQGQGIQSASDCPAAVMPAWLAYVVVTLFDRQSATDAIAWARRFGAQMAHPRWLVVDWDHIRNEWLVGVITNALEAARKVADKEVYWAQVEDAHRQVVAVLRGDDAAAYAAVNAAYAAAYAAVNAAYATYAAAYAAYAAANAAYDAAYAAYAAANAANAAANAAAYVAASATSAANAAAYAATSAATSAANAAALCDIIDKELTNA